MSILIPDSYRDLIDGPVHVSFATTMPDGQPQMSIVWADFDGENVLISTTLERQKGKNMQANPKVNVLLIDPKNGARFLEIRGEVAGYTQDGAITLVNKQTRAYSNDKKSLYYGDIYPEEQQEKETRVIFKIAPKKVTIDAIFS